MYIISVIELYMKSGNVITFAHLREKEDGEYGVFKWTQLWEEGRNTLKSISNFSTVTYKNIPRINFVDWGNVEGIATVSEEEVESVEELTRLCGDIEGL